MTLEGYQLKVIVMTKVIKWLYRDNKTRNSGTCWELWGGHISADHVYIGARNTIPHFARGPVQRATGLLDVVLYGCQVPAEPPRDPIEGEQVTVSGYPAGAGTLEHRYGTVHIRRPADMNEGSDYSIPTWIGKIDQPHIPYPYDSTLFDAVYGGMSGGLVSAKDGTPLGVLVTQNGLADLDSDGISDDSFDFVSLRSVWEVFSHANLVG